MENSTVQENISKTEIEKKEIEGPNAIQIEETSPAQKEKSDAIEENASSISILKESYSTNVNENSFVELSEGVSISPPNTVNSFQRSQPSMERRLCSTSKTRHNNLSNPKGYYVQDTLKQFGEILNDRSRENLKKLLQEEKNMQATIGVNMKKCISTPTAHPRIGHHTPVNTDQKIQNLNEKLKRYAFDRMADKIFAELPHHVLQADITKLSEQSATTQLIINVIFTSLCSYTGKPLSLYDHELYQHLSVVLARFIENVIESVQQSAERKDEQFPQRNRRMCSLTTALLGELPEGKFLRDSSLFKTKTPNVDDGPIEN